METPIGNFNNIPMFVVLLRLCTFYKGLPYGPANISFINQMDPSLSFEGVGIFYEGKLHGGPFTCIDGNGKGI